MKKLNGMILVLAGTIGCGLYAGEKEPTTPRTKAMLNFKYVLDNYDFGVEHVAELIELKPKIDRELRSVKAKQEQQVRKAQLLLQQISQAIDATQQKSA